MVGLDRADLGLGVVCLFNPGDKPGKGLGVNNCVRLVSVEADASRASTAQKCSEAESAEETDRKE